MTDTPDFDSMTPEEMMEWMESLAKKQGVTEGLTTAADMQIDDVDENDERLEGVGEYIPYGWKEEDWKAHLAKEEAEKAAKQAEQAAAVAPPPAPIPEPEPVPEPVAEAPAADAGGTPDFDSMTPEEMMTWMETLAIRQGATDGMTTSGDMQIDEVDENDERLEGMGEYIPYGWKEEDWKAHLAKEEAEKAAKQAEQPAAVAIPIPEPEAPAPIMDVEPAAPDFLDNLFNAGSNELPTLDAVGGIEEETAAAEPVAADPTDWLSGLTDDNSVPELDLSALDGLNENPLAGLDIGGGASDDPTDWLSGLTGSDDANDLSALAAIGDSDNTIPEAPVASNPAADDPIAWMEALAAGQGADPAELVTDAGAVLPGGLDLSGADDGPGYREYSFEGGGDAPSDTNPLDFAIDFESGSNVIDEDNAEDWLDGLASSQKNRPADPTPEPDFFGVDEDSSTTDDDDSLGVLRELESGKDVDPAAMQGFFEDMFKKAAEPDNARRDKMPLEEIISENIDAPVDENVELESSIPDWLVDQMGGQGLDDIGLEIPGDAGQSEDDMAAVLEGLGDADQEDSLGWLIEDGGGDDIDDIFAPEPEVGSEPVSTTPVDSFNPELNTGDSWVEAFDMEQNPQAIEQLETWYDKQSRVLDSGGTPQPVPEADSTPLSPVPDAASIDADAGLQTADLPIETRLPAGEPEALPDWLSGDSAEPAIPDFAAIASDATDTQENMPDWLNTSELEEADVPDWLSGGSNEIEEATEATPDWLNPAAVADSDDIPDWLRDTMTEEQLTGAISGSGEIDFDFAEIEETVTPAPAATTLAPVPASPAPVPMVVANIDVAATLQSARSKVSGGDVDSSLQDYEAIVRANAALDDVVKDVKKLVDDKAHKKNPAVYRVLGDALMRTGELQDALDTYRKALNLL
ncbi:MAG: hypothetical protein ACPG7F_01640 [Aggregatilineales bacterium]